MDPATIALLITAGLRGIQQIAEAIDAANGNRATDEQIALLIRLRDENQEKSDRLGEKLRGTNPS